MDWTEIPPFLVTAVLAVGGWFVVNRLNTKREHAAQRRSRRVEFLLDAYRRLERAVEAVEPKKHWQDVETALADIQLLGTDEQVLLAERAMHALGNGPTNMIELLTALRDDHLRVELDLEPLARTPLFLRFRDGSPTVPSNDGQSENR